MQNCRIEEVSKNVLADLKRLQRSVFSSLLAHLNFFQSHDLAVRDVLGSVDHTELPVSDLLLHFEVPARVWNHPSLD